MAKLYDANQNFNIFWVFANSIFNECVKAILKIMYNSMNESAFILIIFEFVYQTNY